MLVVFPVGLWTFSLVSDVILALGWGGPIWSDIAFCTMAGGLVGALAAAIPGFIDYLAIIDRNAAKTATRHLIVNLTLVVLYGCNLFLRTQTPPGATLPIFLSVLGVVMLGFSGWLGGELVYVHRVGVNRTDGDALPAREDERNPRRLRAVR
jgi:uncharacterized membrane protein